MKKIASFQNLDWKILIQSILLSNFISLRQKIFICVIGLFLFGFFSATSNAGVLNDYNSYNVTIPDNDGNVNSDLSLSGAPSNAVITKVKVYYEIRHTYPGDLDVWLTAYYNGSWHDYYLYHQGDIGGTDNIIETRDNIHAWDGASPNQTWYLGVRDKATGDQGYIDFFELWITYEVNEAPTTPSSPYPSGGATNVSRTVDLNWSCSDPNGDTIYYTVYFEKNDSSPDNVIKNNSTGKSADTGTLDYDSHYYWRVKADDHNEGVAWSPVLDFYTEAEPVVNAEITGVSFNRSQVKRGQESITATITFRNTGNQNWTFYVGSSSIKQGDTIWYDWTPARASKTLSPGQTGTVNISWTPNASVSTGTYGFFSKVFKYGTGDEFVDDDWQDSVISVVNPPLSLNGRISYHSYSGYLATPLDSVDGNVFVYNLNTTNNQNLTGSLIVQNSMNPHFSPDGSKITFMAIPNGSSRAYSSLEIYVYDLAEAKLVRLTQNSIPDEDPKFAPDGRKIVFKRNSQVYTINTDGSNAQQVTTTADEKSGPNYSLDGLKIVYWSNVGSSADIWWMNANGSNPSKIVGITSLQEYYPIFRDSNRILYTRWESVSDQHDKVYQYSISTAQSERLQINVTGVEDSDPFPFTSTLIGFSSQRSGGKGGWDVYIGESSNSTYYAISQINSQHHDLGGTYSQYRYARKAKVVSPANGANLEVSSSYNIKVRAFSDGGIWTNANPSVILSGPVTLTFSGLKDDGTGGDQTAGDGIYSKTVTLPTANGAYTVTANAVSSDNGLQNNIVSENIDVNLYQPTGSLHVTISPQEAIDAGAQWRRVGTSIWYNSGYMESEIPVGFYSVEFKSVSEWNSPSNKNVTINNKQTTNESGTYTQQTGSLKVTISPQEAINDGAQWRRVGTSTWLNSGYTETNISIGLCTVEFKDITGWEKPANQDNMMINNGQISTVSGVYTQITSVNEVPTAFRVWPPFPNPFNPITTIKYEIPSQCYVSIIVYDINGREVAIIKEGIHSTGIYNALWDGKDNDGKITASGVYLYRLEAGPNIDTGKILFLR